MDKLSVLGLIIALGAIAIGYSLEGGVVTALFNGPALIIVLGGTLGAVMLQTATSTFKKNAKHEPLGVFFHPSTILSKP